MNERTTTPTTPIPIFFPRLSGFFGFCGAGAENPLTEGPKSEELDADEGTALGEGAPGITDMYRYGLAENSAGGMAG